MESLYEKIARVLTELQPHQERLVEKLRASGGVVADWGLGTGKTLGSIAAKDRLGVPADVIVPAPLQANYRKELQKHLGEEPDDVRIRSYEGAAKDNHVDPSGLVVFDEAHRGRNAGTGAAKLMDQARAAKYRLFLTGTPVYNSPADLAPLINAAAGRKVLPDDPNLFKQTFVGQTVEEAPLWDRLKGRVLGHPIHTEPRPTLINRDRLVQATRGYVDFHRGGGAGFPDRIDEEHLVDMSPKQRELYTFAEGKMPWYLRAKIRAGLPMSKQESKELNAFQGALRQIANTPRGFAQDINDENEAEHSPKIQRVVDHLLDARKKDPNHRGVIYSNYLESGVHPLSRALTKAGVPHSVFTGDVSGPRRAQMVADYNAGKTPVLLVSGAGSEGLDLKGTRTIQLLEPHWHDQRPAQVIGRGIRYKSHEHLPEKDRNVRVMRYYSTLPKDVEDRLGTLIGMKPKQSIEQYLKHMSGEKTHITDQIADALQEASDYGPLQKRAIEEVSQRYALPYAVLSKVAGSRFLDMARKGALGVRDLARVGLHGASELHGPNVRDVRSRLSQGVSDLTGAAAQRHDMLNGRLADNIVRRHGAFVHATPAGPAMNLAGHTLLTHNAIPEAAELVGGDSSQWMRNAGSLRRALTEHEIAEGTMAAGTARHLRALGHHTSADSLHPSTPEAVKGLASTLRHGGFDDVADALHKVPTPAAQSYEPKPFGSHLGPSAVLSEQQALWRNPEAQRMQASLRITPEEQEIARRIKQYGGTESRPLPLGGKAHRKLEQDAITFKELSPDAQRLRAQIPSAYISPDQAAATRQGIESSLAEMRAYVPPEQHAELEHQFGTMAEAVENRAGIRHPVPDEGRQLMALLSAPRNDANPWQKEGAVRDSPDDLLARVVERMGDSQLGKQKRERYIEFSHPAGITLRSPYDASFLADQVREKYEGDPHAFADQIRDDLLNMGYATLGSITKKNQQLQQNRAIQGAAYGSLAGSILGPVAGAFAAEGVERALHRKGWRSSYGLPLLTYFATGFGVPVALGTAGFQIGKHTYKPLGNEDVIAKNTHPLLMPPKPVKQKVKLVIDEK